MSTLFNEFFLSFFKKHRVFHSFWQKNPIFYSIFPFICTNFMFALFSQNLAQNACRR